jgi:DNA replication protein DnaC
MLDEMTLTTLNALKLFGMANNLPARLADARQADLSHAEFVGLLAQDEKTYRDNKRLKRLLKNARLKQEASLEDIDYRQPRGLHKQTLLELGNTGWIEGNRNIVLTGPTGVGKSYIACALGNFAARTGYTVAYTRAARLFDTLQAARADGSHLRLMQKYNKARLLIVDDFLIAPLSDTARMDFLELIEDRTGGGATVITSQCPVKEWHPGIGDPTIADAICDRVLHNAYKIELRGESMRKRMK